MYLKIVETCKNVRDKTKRERVEKKKVTGCKENVNEKERRRKIYSQ
jgi:hypothetical protein